MAKQTNKIEIEPLKPRNKQVNDVLRRCKGGVHYDARRDYNRAKEKAKYETSKGDED